MAELTAEESFAASTKELKALLKNYGNLGRAITDPGSGLVVLDLISVGLISELTMRKTCVPGTAPVYKTYYLLNDLRCAVASNSENFHKLIEILSDASPALDEVTKLMRNDYGKAQFTCNLHLF